MSTTIDSLQIEIKTNSASAASGIQDLAGALGELKKNGAIGTATKNIGLLADALKKLSPAVSGLSGLSDVADAISKLKSAGTLTALAKSIELISPALRGLSEADLTGVDGKLRSLATALGELKGMKTGSFNSTMKYLGDLGKITAGLDEATIAEFSTRVKALVKELGPLSEKMTSIKSGLSGFNSKLKATSTYSKQAASGINSAAVNASSFVTVMKSAVSAMRGFIDKLQQFVSQALEWDGISARFGRGFGEAAEETYSWVQRLNEEMGINIQQFMQYSSVYATMLTGFGVAAEDAATMALGYTELTYDIWAGYNDIYKNFEDAADAVKSAIAGEVEPIRRAGFTIVEATLEQTAANHDLDISLSNATEAQKSYLRYLTLIDQAYAQSLVGTYAKELNTAEGVMRTLSQQLKSLAQSLGSLLLPILVQIVPYLQAFVELLTDAVQGIAALFGVTIQGVDWSSSIDSTDDLTGSIDSATAAAKELKNATLGIDELNVISPPDSSGSGGASGGSGFEGLDIESLWDESIFDNIQSQVAEIKAGLEDWMPVIKSVGAALGALSLYGLLEHMGTAIAQMDALSKMLAAVATVLIEAALVFTFADNYLETGNVASLIGEALATAGAGYLLYKGFGDKGIVIGMIVSLAAQISALTLNIADGGVDVDSPEVLTQEIMAAFTGAVGGWMAFKGIAQIGGVKGAALGALVSLALTLAGVTVGGVIADGVDEEDICNGLLSAALGGVAGAGLVTLLGTAVTGGVGFAIGFSVMAVLNIAGAIIGSVEESVEDDLEAAFGDIELSVSEVNVVIDKLVPEWADGVALAVELRADLEGSVSAMESHVEALNSYHWQVSVGLGLSADDQEAYKQTIDAYVASVQQYVIDRGYALEVGLTTTAAPESVVESANSIASTASAELERLGSELQSFVNAAFEDGLLDIDEMKVVQELQAEMALIQELLAGSKIQAEIDMFEMKWSGVDLTLESAELMMQEWDALLNDTIKPNLEDTVTANLADLEGNVAFAEYELAKDPNNPEKQQLLDDAEAALQDYINSNPLETMISEVDLQFDTFQSNTFSTAFSNALDNVFQDALIPSSFWLKADHLNVGRFVEDMYLSMVGGISQMDISDEMRVAIDEKLAESIPRFEELTAAAEKARSTGEAVPEEVRNGLTDIYTWKAMSGDAATQMEGVTYLIGEKLSTDPSFLALLATAEGAAIATNETLAAGLMNNLTVVGDAATNTVTFLKDGIEIAVVDATPELMQNMSDLGINLGDALGGQSGYVYDEAAGMFQSVVDASNDTIGSTSSTLNANGIAQGESYTDGIDAGMARETIKSKLSNMWAEGSAWWSQKTELKEYTPSVGSITDELKTSWDKAKLWWEYNARLTVPSVSMKVEYNTRGLTSMQQSVIKALNLPGWPKLKFAANGGIFDQGSLVWAGERGAEIVANAGGGKTGVMNVEQMQQAVYEGVLAAMSAAQRAANGSGNQAVNVYLDGKAVAKSVEKWQRERGATIMGNEVYSY